MNNKFILRFLYFIIFLISFGLIVFYSRLTYPSIVIGSIEGDPLVIHNAIVLFLEIVIITFIGALNYFFYRYLYGAHGTENPFVKFVYVLLVLAIFTAISLVTLRVINVGINVSF